MKKRYSIPASKITSLNTESLIAESLFTGGNDKDNYSKDTELDVKTNRASHNIWDNDWSK